MTASLEARQRAARERVTALFTSGLTGAELAAKIPVSQRGVEILQLTAQGLTNQKIGQRLHITEDTVKTHKRRIATAMGAVNGLHAVAMAYKMGILKAFVSRCPACGWAAGRRTDGGAS